MAASNEEARPMTTRRDVLKGGAAAAALSLGAPGLAQAQTAPARARTLRAVMHADLASIDPIWTTANMASYHGGLVYDTLFGIDADFRPQPQMVGRHGVSEDRRTWTFELRDGLRFSDGSPVTARDCVASVRRWAARDGAGQHLWRRVTDTPVVDDKTFRIVLREPYPLILDWLAKASTSVCYVMREREAGTDPNQQITEVIGSGPFVMNRTESRQGARYVYDRNPNYVPRAEPPSFMAGGKVAKMDRIVFDNMPDLQTAVAALQAAEIDLIEWPPLDIIDQLEADRNIRLEVLNRTGSMGWARLNFLHPPFDNVLARRAMLHLVHPTEIMKATFGNEKYYRACASLFGCGTPMENDANTDWFKAGQDIPRARELFRQAGYDGRPVVLLQATNVQHMSNAAQMFQQWLRAAGVNAQLAPSDWGGVVARRANRNPPDQGGWNVFFTSATGSAFGNPVALAGHSSTGANAWFGWPSDARNEELRDKWAAATSHEERLAAARDMQANAWTYVPHVYYGQWLQPAAMRANLRGLIAMPELVPFWNVERV
jgi:peptide/nickel transport system substrate-binding protein